MFSIKIQLHEKVISLFPGCLVKKCDLIFTRVTDVNKHNNRPIKRRHLMLYLIIDFHTSQ